MSIHAPYKFSNITHLPQISSYIKYYHLLLIKIFNFKYIYIVIYVLIQFLFFQFNLSNLNQWFMDKVKIRIRHGKNTE